jgi:hypothetical protein
LDNSGASSNPAPSCEALDHYLIASAGLGLVLRCLRSLETKIHLFKHSKTRERKKKRREVFVWEGEFRHTWKKSSKNKVELYKVRLNKAKGTIKVV